MKKGKVKCRCYFLIILFLILIGILVAPFVVSRLVTIYPQQGFLKLVNDWFNYRGTYFAVMIGAYITFVVSILIIICIIIRSNRSVTPPPHLIVVKHDNILKEDFDYLMEFEDRDRNAPKKRVNRIEVFYPVDKDDIKDLEERAEEIKKLVRLIQEKNQVEVNRRRAQLVNTSINVNEQLDRELQSYKTKIDAQQAEAFSYLRDNFKTLFLSVENVSSTIAMDLKFFTIIRGRKQRCYCVGQEIDNFCVIRPNSPVSFKFTFKNCKIYKNVKFSLLYKDLGGKLYKQDIVIECLTLPNVQIGEPVLQKNKDWEIRERNPLNCPDRDIN